MVSAITNNQAKDYYFAQWIRGAYYDKDADPDHVIASSYLHVVCLQRDEKGIYSYSNKTFDDGFIAEIRDPDKHFEAPQGTAFNYYGENESTDKILDGYKANAREYYAYGLSAEERNRFEAATVTARGGWIGAITAAAKLEAALNDILFKAINESELPDDSKTQYISDMLPRLRAAIINPKTGKIRERTEAAFWKNISRFFDQEIGLLHIYESKQVIRMQRSLTSPFKTGQAVKSQILKSSKKHLQMKAFVSLFDQALEALSPEQQAKEFERFLNTVNQYAFVDSSGEQINLFISMLAAARAAQLCTARQPWALNSNTTGVLSRFDERTKIPDEFTIKADVLLRDVGMLTDSVKENPRVRQNAREQLKKVSAQTYIIERKATDKASGKTVVKETVKQLFTFSSSRDEAPANGSPKKHPRGPEYWTFSGISDLLLPLEIEHAQFEKIYLRPAQWLNQNCTDKRTASALSKAIFWITLKLNDYKNAAEMDLKKKICCYEDDLSVLNLPRSENKQQGAARLTLLQLALQQINVDFKWTEKQDRFTATIELDDPKRITIGDVIAKGDDPTTIIETKIKKTVKKEVEQQIKARKAKRGKKADSTKPHGKK